MNFCPKCGSIIKNESKFCQNCGDTLTSEPDNVTETIKIDQTSETDKSSDKSKDIQSVLKLKFLTNPHSKAIIAIISICVVIAIFVCVGKTLSNPNKTVVAFQNAISKNDTTSLIKILYASDERLSLTSGTVGPLLTSLKTTPSDLSDVISDLNTQVTSLKSGGGENETSNLYLAKVGTILLFFPQYKIAVKPSYMTVTSDVQGADILVNGKETTKTDSTSFSKQLGPYIPGTYNVIGKATGYFGAIHNETKVDFLNSADQSNTIDALKGIYLQVSSYLDNNEVYINGKNTGKSVNSGDTIGPVASGSNIYGVATYNGIQVKSTYSNPLDDAKTINFDYSAQQNTVDQQKSDLSNLVTGYSYALATALTSGDTTSLQGYMYPGSALYNQQIASVNSDYNGGIFNEQYSSAVVNSYTINPNNKSGTVDTTEVYDINENTNDPNSQFQIKTYENVYEFQYNNTTQSFQLSERVSAVAK